MLLRVNDGVLRGSVEKYVTCNREDPGSNRIRALRFLWHCTLAWNFRALFYFGKTQKIHECICCCHDMIEIMLRAALNCIQSVNQHTLRCTWYNISTTVHKAPRCWFLISVYSSWLPAWATPQKDCQLLRGIVQGYRTKLLRAPPGSLTCSAYSTVTRDLGLTFHPQDY